MDMVIRGLPHSVAMDGWWLDGPPPTGTEQRGRAAVLRPGLALALLVLLADLLFWQQPPGLSLAVYALALFAVAVADVRPLARLRGPAVLAVASALPVVDYVQPLSQMFLLFGLVAAVVWARLPEGRLAALAGAVLVLLVRMPVGGLIDLGTALTRRPAISHFDPLRLLRAWAIPVGGTLIFAALLLDANPVLARLMDLRPEVQDLPQRIAFWSGVALVVWPFVDRRPLVTPALAVPQIGPLPGVNAGSTLRALVMFNLLIGVQTALDLSILMAGAALPDGMTHAEYAHRGAYPLLATALLAGAFALAARPYLAAHRLIRPLMLLWLGQNVLLALSALLRLDLYVGQYGLTYLRVHAMIWIGLVAAGLVLLGWQTVRRQTNGSVLLRIGGMGLATLYAACFVNFAAIIMADNLRLAERDSWYLCRLGATAAAAAPQLGYCLGIPRIDGWRDWGLRNWRVARYLETTPLQRPPRDDPDRG